MPQRDTIFDLTHVPSLRTGNGEKFLYTFGLALDALAEKMDQATRAHIPGLARTPTAIPYQAEDRLLVQGPAESNAQFVERLTRAFKAWRKAGSREAILEQLKAYRTGLDPGVVETDPSMLIVGGNGTYTTWDTATFGDAPEDEPSRRRVTPSNFDWDGQDRPWRSWLVLFMRDVATGVAGTAASVSTVGGSGVSGVFSGFATLTGLADVPTDALGMWITVSGAASAANNGRFQVALRLSDTSVMIANPGPGVAPDANNGAITWSLSAFPFFRPTQAWGSPTLVWGSFTWGLEWAGHDTQLVIAAMRQILRRWKSARTYYPNILVSFDGGDGTAGRQFSPLSSKGSGNPNGNYGDYGTNVNGVWTPRARDFPLTCFLDGTGQYLRCNVHNVT